MEKPHDTRISRSPYYAPFPFMAMCSCSWVEFAHSEDHAERIAFQHELNFTDAPNGCCC